MNEQEALQSTAAMPRQLALGTVYLIGVITVAASITVSLIGQHGPTAYKPVPLPERIAPVARVELVAGGAASAPAAAPASTPDGAAAAAATATPAGAAVAPGTPGKSEEKPAAAPAAAAAGKSGAEVYQAICSACHGSGAAGAPKFGDKAAWAPRLAQGQAGLIKNAIAGKGAMPPKGGSAALTDAEVARAVIHMANAAGASFKEAAAKTVAPAAAGAAPAAATATAGAATAAKPETAGGTAQVSQPVLTKAELAAKKRGADIYKAVCSACHATGAAGAPKLGDIAAWGPRFASGADALLASALNGKGAMPPKGGNASLTTDDVKAALEYMLGQFK